MWRLCNRNKTSTSTLTKTWRATTIRWYHDDEIYGYRAPLPAQMADYTPQELENRNVNANLLRLVLGHRNHGHRAATVDPLGLQKPVTIKALKPERYGLVDLEKVYNLSGILHMNTTNSNGSSLGGVRQEADLRSILLHLNHTYCGYIGFEFMHIPNQEERRWFSHRIESADPNNQPSDKERRRIFSLLTNSEVFDLFMQKRFTQVKRYGLEGAEGMLIVLDSIFKHASQTDISSIVLGMPHRGRLNLLADLLKYPLDQLFHKIKGKSELPEGIPGIGDVLSHISCSPLISYEDPNCSVKVTLLPNPSHLEAVNPVVMGKARAKQMDLMPIATNCQLGDRVLGVQIHGDAAFSGQGIVMESLGLSNLPHFSSGGSVHLIVNNQLGYTTPATNARSSFYTSDIGKMINAPIIHVNGDHPESVAHATKIGFEYRQRFRKDVLIDLVTYRRWGHNELDEPSFTQPLMYDNIRNRTSVPKQYEERLTDEGLITNGEKIRSDHFALLDKGMKDSDNYQPQAIPLTKKWKGFRFPADSSATFDTGVSQDILHQAGIGSVSYPADWAIHPRLLKYHIQTRQQRIQEGKNFDWATAEALAFGSLLLEGYSIRISGQDVGRGTFSQRHAMFVCQRTERVCVPLNGLSTSQGMLEVVNSSLSELAVLGFEYGMSIENPKSLIIWEAQFGDFFNSAQVIIDTFLSSGEAKWLKQSGLVMLLPHGMDGTGPEHSSCRMERFLQLTDDPFTVSDLSQPVNVNMHIVNPTTPAQYFHLLRRQMKRDFRKPLIVVGPKTLLRHPNVTSDFNDMLPGTAFQPVLGDQIAPPESVQRVCLVSGKMYYDLVKERKTRKLEDKMAIIRIEELCPFPRARISQELSRYEKASEVYWCQEEHQNSGAYSFIQPRMEDLLPKTKLVYAGRGPAPAPATGISTQHKKEQTELFKACFAGLS